LRAPPLGGELAVGQVLAATYRLDRLLGRGGMGAVYEASHLRLSRRFAIKVLYPSLLSDAQALVRFYREAEITSQLGHPHIVEVVDFQHEEGAPPYIVMELLEGEDLTARVRRKGPLPLVQAASILRQACSALHAAHERGVIHRDLKPGNVFLARRGAHDDYVKILDFGISKMLGAQVELTTDRSVIGTPGYMAPEQATGRTASVDRRTDVFAMGALLYYMLSGSSPFAASNEPATLYRIVHEEPDPLELQRPDLPDGVIAAVAAALRKPLDSRCPSMAALWRQFSAAADLSGDEWDLPTEDRPLAAARAEASGPGGEMAETPSGASTARNEPQALPGTRRMVDDMVAPRRLRLALGLLIAALLLAASGFGYWRWRGRASHATADATPAAARDVARTSRTDARPAARDVAPARPADARAAPGDVRPDLPVDRGAHRRARRHRASKLHRSATPLPATASLHVVTTADDQPLWAEVKVDGQPAGKSPVSVSQLAPGRHLVAVERAGYRATSRRLVLRAGERRRVVVKLRRTGPER